MFKFSQKHLIVGGVVAALGLSFASVANAKPTESLDPNSVLPALASPQAEGDQVLANNLPPGISTEVDHKSLRTVGIDDLGTYLVAKSTRNEICLIVKGGLKNDSFTWACSTPADFHRSGIHLTMSGKLIGTPRAVYLFPKGVDASSLRNTPTARWSGISEEGSQILATTNDSMLPEQADLPRNTGSEKFQFHRSPLSYSTPGRPNSTPSK